MIVTLIPAPGVKRPARPADDADVGDWLRRILYPLVGPVIVVALWAHAHSLRQQQRVDALSLPPLPTPNPSQPSDTPTDEGGEDGNTESTADEGWFVTATE